MKFGLTPEQYKLLENLVIQPLQKNQAKVFIFGSRARGKHHPFSDIDILYQENQKHPIQAREISDIKENIENSNFTIKLDLINEKDLAVSYRKSVTEDLILIPES